MKHLTEFLQTKHITNTEYIDLGLPSGTLWADRNIGAQNPEDAGDYYQWGGLKPQNHNTNDTYHCNHMDDNNDIIYVTTKGKYKMPTPDNFTELFYNVTPEWKEKYVILTSKINGKKIIFPYSGFYTDIICPKELEYLHFSLLWTSDCCKKSGYNEISHMAHISGSENFDNPNLFISKCAVYFSLNVRGVLNK